MAMADASDLLQQLNQKSRETFQELRVVMSFGGYLERLRAEPEALVRNSSQYLRDCFDHFGHRTVGVDGDEMTRWKIFDLGTEKNVPIIGGELVQEEIYKILTSYVRQGFTNKLILLHGPNGSAKTSLIESIACAMQRYSHTEQGAVYRFNWIFPTDKTGLKQVHGESGPIGFGGRREDGDMGYDMTYAFLDEAKIASKIHSEFRENPIFLIPMPQREIWLRQWIAEAKGISPDDVELPPHVLLSGLSKRNQLIFENLLAAYDGDLVKVLRHVQIERFFYSRQYRIGVGTVEPQMSIDAIEKQLTMDRNIANLPPILHNISFYESMGPLVEANRGILEFSDMLKRPLETFKYLLSTVEKGTLNLPSSTANLDIVFVATTNEKHLDAFKTIPDFASFKSRFELVTVPYLLQPSLEEMIYERDVRALQKSKRFTPHSLRLLCLWSVMTRLKQPDPEYYPSKYRPLIARLDPYSKVRLYENQTMAPTFKPQEESVFRELRPRIRAEYQDVVVFEGRFGASPREIRNILYRAVQNPHYKTLTPMAIFDELERLVKDRTVYEFLQLEPRGKYHQPAEFIKVIKADFAQTFEREVTQSMTLVEESQYESLLNRYVENVVATVKREKIYNKVTGSHEAPSETLMKEVEKILGITGSVERHREGLLGRIAAYRLDHPNETIQVGRVFHEYLETIQQHYYKQRQKLVEQNYRAMIVLGTDDERSLSTEDATLARQTFEELERRFGYDHDSARECLKFLMTVHTQTPVS